VSAPAPAAGEDAAWVKVEMPLPPPALHAFLADIERLFRINPWLEIDRFERRPDGGFGLAGRNLSNEQPLDATVRLSQSVPGRSLTLRYDGGIKRETRCEIEPAAAGSVLTITETYDTPPPEQREARLKEVDRSLVPWAAALRAFLLHGARWGWLPGYRLYMRRVWLPMTPKQRRITRLIVWTTVIEFVVFLFIFAIFWNEAGRG
jgi:hypothetical protein